MSQTPERHGHFLFCCTVFLQCVFSTSTYPVTSGEITVFSKTISLPFFERVENVIVNLFMLSRYSGWVSNTPRIVKKLKIT